MTAGNARFKLWRETGHQQGQGDQAGKEGRCCLGMIHLGMHTMSLCFLGTE